MRPCLGPHVPDRTVTLTLIHLNVIRTNYHQNLMTSSTPHLSTEFCENRSSRFFIILLTNEQTDADENVTSLAEVTTLCLKKLATLLFF